MTTFSEVQLTIQKLTNKKVTYSAIGEVLGTGRSNISARAKTNSKVTEKEIKLLEHAYNVNLMDDIKNQLEEIHDAIKEQNLVKITYRPDVYLSAGYGVEVFNEAAERITIDARLLETEKGIKINPKNCELVRVSGNSMAPEYRHGDRVIIDKSDTELIDGHIFAFKYKGQCFVKEINILSDKIKCISLNKEYDPFYIKHGEEFTVFGRILPRIRL
jgi:phage repressor protein C with HTH and peptisase S24 domain